MDILQDQRLQIDSAAEEYVLGKAAAVAVGNGTLRVYFKHRPELDPTSDEVEFFNRSQKYGELVLSTSRRAQTEEGLDAIIERGDPINGITPGIATMFKNRIHERQRDRMKAVVQDPQRRAADPDVSLVA